MNCLSVRRSKAALVGGVAASRMASTPIVDANVPETSLPIRAVNLWNDLQRQLIELSKQDFAIINELAEAYDDDCTCQLLLVQLR
jgi:hypothetical protein